MRKEHLKEDIIHVRVNKEEKEEVSQILEALGTNLSAVINMMIRNIILYKGIPFDVVLPKEENRKELSDEDNRTAEAENISLSNQEEKPEDFPNNDFSQHGMEGAAVSEQESLVNLNEDKDVFDTSDLDEMEGLLGISLRSVSASGEKRSIEKKQLNENLSIMSLLD